MDGDQPIGGLWNFDKDNRKPLPKTERAPALLSLTPDAITQQVIAEVEASAYGSGTAAGFAYAVTHEDAQKALEQFIAERLVKFGPYEDAMSSTQDTLYHSVLSPYINIGLLTPMQMIRAAEQAYYDDGAPINSVEGFIRQVLGWREYMIWQYWRRGHAWQTDNAWDAQRQMPSFFWTGDTRMNCLKHIITRLHDSAYTHHIERLMVVSNFCLLAGVHPQAVVHWFMDFYIDAYDWAMQPNVIGMGLNADGGATATKPYIASANYINKMSDYCKGCTYHHKARTGENACPFNTLYWNFLIEHEAELRGNPRLGPAVLGLKHLDEDERAQVQQEARVFLKNMANI
jgi:deoxyribodipyrimidine photolyase-related protein